ncbi:alpha/beta fold hydrolase [Variovorax ureilyticus]|uniref:alpha/beta fold hydrolase n=1 Tax=Variovorax ureilyticus TaxID=1836198 RepID=UPI003D67CE47
MELKVNGHATYCYTGGKTLDNTKPTVVFIHGVLNDHSVWILQSRWFANHGWNVLAVDLPGHCRSEGPPPATVEEAAGFIIALLDAAGVAKAALAGHSFGSLIALEAAARSPERVSHLALVGTAYPMTVSPALLDGALNDPQRAIAMVNTFSHSLLAPPPSSLGPGTGSTAPRARSCGACWQATRTRTSSISASRPATTMRTAKPRWRRCNARRCSCSARRTR